MYSKHISRQQQEQRQAAATAGSSLNIFALFPFGFCKTSALQSCHNFAAPPSPRSPAGISCCRCSFRSGSASWWSYTKKKKKKTNAERRQLRRQQQFQVPRQSPDWLSLWGVVGGLPFGQLLTAPCRYFCSTPITTSHAPPPSLLQFTQSLSINFCLRFSVLRQSERERERETH